jgi:hypothetical protein
MVLQKHTVKPQNPSEPQLNSSPCDQAACFPPRLQMLAHEGEVADRDG